MSLAVTGADKLAAVGRDLGRAGGRLRYRMRRSIVTATAPITSEAKAGWSGSYGGLGAALAAATKTSVRTVGPSVGVSVRVDGSALPEGKQGLPPLVEGFAQWRHPLFGLDHWYSQDPHPELKPAVERHLPGVQIAVVRAVDETAAALAAGSA